MSRKKAIDICTVVTQVEELVSSDLDGETVMMSVQNGKYYGSNCTIAGKAHGRVRPGVPSGVQRDCKASCMCGENSEPPSTLGQ